MYTLAQILYLDNIDFGVLNLPHDKFPRVKHFCSDLLRSMVQVDIVEDPSDSSGFTFGRNKVTFISCMLDFLVFHKCTFSN